MAKGVAEGVAESLAKQIPEIEAKIQSQEQLRLNSFYGWLFENNRIEDAKIATSDPEYCSKLFSEYEKACNR